VDHLTTTLNRVSAREHPDSRAAPSARSPDLAGEPAGNAAPEAAGATRRGDIRRVAIVTDAWHPQVNGVVNTLDHTGAELRAMGYEVRHITPQQFRSVPCPTYPSIRLAVLPGRAVAQALDDYAPEAIHIATEGPLGHAAHRYCRQRGLAFTTSFHTQFPEYIRARAPVPVAWTYHYLRRYHGRAARTLVPTPTQQQRLSARGFANLQIWPRGVDTAVFRPNPSYRFELPRPLAMYMGRVAVEKNIEAFLRLDLPGSKVVVGDGPDLEKLRQAYPQVRFLGQKLGADLAACVAGADVFVFPSRTDTFGLVLLEAMACGVPVAAFPVTGPLDVVQQGRTGVLDEDLGHAVEGALALKREDCVAYAARYTWRRCTEIFAGHLTPAR
jgi:glycosyltransferase involved in cell wall biosynthesis